MIKISLFILSAFLVIPMGSTSINQVRVVTCPRKCTCSRNFKMITCTYQKLTEVPLNIPVTATELYLSHNSLTTIGASAFINLTNLTQLGLNNNQLQTLDVNAFKGLQSLKILYLGTNLLTDLRQQLFSNVSKLETLYVANNRLTNIPDLSLALSLRVLGLDTNHLQRAKFPAGFSELLQLSTVDLTNNADIKEINLTDFQSLNRLSIRSINMGRCNIARVDSGVFDFLHLQSLTLSYNPLSFDALRNICASGFKELTSLKLDGVVHQTIPFDLFQNLTTSPIKHLFLSNSNFTAILNGTFDYFPMLESLDLSFNRLNQIDQSVFSPKLKSLKTLLLHRNKLSGIPNMDLPSLQALSLQQNRDISALPNMGFQGLAKLEKLNLSTCTIKILQTESFVGLSSLTLLDLSRNIIGGNSIPAAAFNPLTHLQTLDLSYNNMNTVATESDLFSLLSQLKKLDMSGNKCSNMSLKIFQPLQLLTDLVLSSNQLSKVIAEDVAGQLFEGLSTLQRLSINNNALYSLPQLLVKNLTSLESLDVSLNVLSSWPAHLIPPSTSGSDVMIDFTSNKITVVSELEFAPMSKVVHLNLSNNPFACGCDMMWFRRWISANNRSAMTRLENLTNYICSSPQAMAHHRLLDFNPDDIEKSCNPPPWRWILVGVGAGIFVIMILAFLLGYRYRWPLRLKWYHLRLRMCAGSAMRAGYEQLSGTDYDIMISYGPSERDTYWVKNSLVPNIEKRETPPTRETSDEPRLDSEQSTEEDGDHQGSNERGGAILSADALQARGYQQPNGIEPSINSKELDQQRWNLFFEEKDIDFNKPVIGALADAIASSNKVLIVLSKEYLKDSRRMYEIELALTAHCSSRDRIILVSLDPDADLRMPKMLYPIAEARRVHTWTWNDMDAQPFWTFLRDEIRRPIVQHASE